ncbi:unannotated protein [freshwater metagenome]|uniref:Unannotated protein n=1 Tax=freshwater metagenome TaxID=449393 RepID=A0A6J7DTJ6_9ZZZZ|nr:alpha/beta fold hydrolase [Actinomycetota bacterium]
MPLTVPGAGVDLEAHVVGEGPSVLLVHDMADGPERMMRLAAQLAEPVRAIAYARRGYRGSGAPEPYAGTTVAEQAEDAASLIGAFGAAGAIALGEGFGALILLDLLLRHPGLVASAVLVDPPLYAFAPESTRELAGERGEMQDAIAAGGPQGGVARWLRDRPGRDEELAQRDHHAFYADYAGLATLPLTRADLRGIAEPLVLLTGPQSTRAALLAAEGVSSLLPGALRREDCDRAGALERLRAVAT